MLDIEQRTEKIERIRVEDRTQQNADFGGSEDITLCEVCQRSDREDRMLLCDGCDNGYHCECLTPALDEIPEGQWFCPECRPTREAGRTRIRRVRGGQASAETSRATTSQRAAVATSQRRPSNFTR